MTEKFWRGYQDLGRVQGGILKESLIQYGVVKPCTYPIYMNLGKYEKSIDVSIPIMF